MTFESRPELEYGEEYFTFEPEVGYTKLRYHDPNKKKAGSAGMASDRGEKRGEEDDMLLHLYNDQSGIERLYVLKAPERQYNFNLKYNPMNKFSMVLYNSGKLVSDQLQFMLGREDDQKKYLNFEGTDLNEHTPTSFKKQEEASYFYLVIQNLEEVITELKTSYKELGDGDGSMVDVGDSFTSVNEALYYCELIGKCKDAYPPKYNPLSGKCSGKLTDAGYTYEMCFDDKVKQVHDATSTIYYLGLADKQKWSIGKDGNDKVLYDGGDECKKGGKSRSVEIKMLCGKDFKVITAKERNCKYRLEVEAKEACKVNGIMSKGVLNLIINISSQKKESV